MNEIEILEKNLIRILRSISNYFWSDIDILANKINVIANIYERIIAPEYKKEYEIFGVLQGYEILHIGCGEYPLTEIVMARLFGVDVTGVDKDPDVIPLARKIVHKNKLDEKIKIEQEDGETYPLDAFDVIIVSSCLHPKIAVLHHIFKNAKKHSTIIVRELSIAADTILGCVTSYKDTTLKKGCTIPLFS